MTSTRSFRRAAGPAAAVLLAALISACSVLPEQAPVTQYRLPTALAAPSAAAQRVSWSLRIAAPQVPAMLESSRIVVLPEGDRVSNYAGARWSGPTASLLQERLVQAFRLDGRVAAVSTDDSNVQADVEIDSSLRAFQSEYRNGRPQVVIGLDANLVDAATRHVLASRSFDITQPADDEKLPAVVAAFGQAADALAAQMVQWTIESVRQ